MKKVAILLAALAASSVMSASVGFAETPTCVMMKFTDDTRFDKVDSAGNPIWLWRNWLIRGS